ncbi:MAG TPA: hypothetical protein VFX59_23370 [Polyangiales bacterium]|nr:hypothetical protein [Polyangiales bacterium]
MLFTDQAVGGPVRPRPLAEPGKAAKRAGPMRAWRHLALPRPHGQHGWARTPGRQFLRP